MSMRNFAIKLAQRKGLLPDAKLDPPSMPQRRGLLSADTIARKTAKQQKKRGY